MRVSLNSFADCTARYGKPWESDRAALDFERQWLDVWRCPVQGMSPLERVYCNRDMLEVLDITVAELSKARALGEIKTFDGCWNVRKVRGSETLWSLHSFGIAIDLNAALMPLGGVSLWSKAFVDTMKSVGWEWGGDFSRHDPMHFQLPRGC